MPRVSVLMPIWNTQENHLREAVESILNQSFKDFESLPSHRGTITSLYGA